MGGSGGGGGFWEVRVQGVWLRALQDCRVEGGLFSRGKVCSGMSVPFFSPLSMITGFRTTRLGEILCGFSVTG